MLSIPFAFMIICWTRCLSEQSLSKYNQRREMCYQCWLDRLWVTVFENWVLPPVGFG